MSNITAPVEQQTNDKAIIIYESFASQLVSLFGGDEQFALDFKQVADNGFFYEHDFLNDHAPLVAFYRLHEQEIRALMLTVAHCHGADCLVDFAWHEADMNDEWTKDDVAEALHKDTSQCSDNANILLDILWSWQVKFLAAQVYLGNQTLTT